MSVPAAAFEARFRADPDPWGFATDPYERAKYDRTLAALGDRRFGRALELGCAIGVLTARLAERCDALVALDGAPTAVAAARARVGAAATVLCGVAPDDVPPGPWELVVASEVLYYLDGPALAATLDAVVGDLRPGGLLLAVHWTGEAASHPQSADAVHAAMLARPELTGVRAERHPGYRLDLLRRG